MTGSLQDKSKPEHGFTFRWPFPEGKPSVLYRFNSYATMTFVAFLSKCMFIRGVNSIVARNKERFLEAIRDESRPLITVSNHRCNIDDPLTWSFLSWREFFSTICRQRYILAAHDICFTKQFHTTLFSLGRCVPCVRGAGINQRGMDFCLEMLNRNQWVHIFPEGKVLSQPIRLKWGVGRLIMEAVKPPILLPIWIEGMNEVWPVEKPYYPRIGKKVDVHIGEPIDTANLRSQMKSLDKAVNRKRVTDAVQTALFELGEKYGSLPAGTLKEIERRDTSRLKYY